LFEKEGSSKREKRQKCSETSGKIIDSSDQNHQNEDIHKILKKEKSKQWTPLSDFDNLGDKHKTLEQPGIY
jgi:hypothetical protein